MSRFGELACLLSVWAVVVCAGCGSSGEADGDAPKIDFVERAKAELLTEGDVELTKTYRDTEHGFSFQYPEQWMESKQPGMIGSVHGLPTVKDPPSVAIVTMTSDPKPGKLTDEDRQSFADQVQNSRYSISSATLEEGLFAGREAFIVRGTMTQRGGTKRESVIYTIEHGDKSLVVIMGDAPARFHESAPTFRSILASFKFFKPLSAAERRKEEKKARKKKEREEKAAVDFAQEAREIMEKTGGVELSRTFKDASLGIRFKYPKDWRRGRIPGVQVYVHGELVDDFGPSAIILQIPYSEQLEKLEKDGWQEVVKQQGSDAQFLTFGRGRFAEKKAIWQHTLATKDDGRKVESWVYYIHSGNKFTVLTLTDDHENFAASEPVFRSILASFELLPPFSFTSSPRDREEEDDNDAAPKSRGPSLAEQALAVELDELLDDEDLPFAIRYPSGWKASVKKSKYRVNLNRPFNDFKTRLSFRHPSTWRQERMQGYHATVAGPVADGFPPCVTLALEPPSKDIFTMTETQALKNLQKGNKSASIKQFEKGRFAGRKAIRQHVVVTRADGKTIEAWMYRIDTGKECLVLTLGDLQTNFAKSKPLFEEILASARLPDYEVDAQEDFVGVLASNLRITEPEDIVLLTGPAGADGHKPTLRLTNYIETSLAGEIAMTRADAKQVPKGDIRPGSAVLIPVGGRTTRFECSIDVTDKAKPVESLVGVRTISIQPVRICLTDSSAGFEESLAVFAAMLQSFQERKK